MEERTNHWKEEGPGHTTLHIYMYTHTLTHKHTRFSYAMTTKGEDRHGWGCENNSTTREHPFLGHCYYYYLGDALH